MLFNAMTIRGVTLRNRVAMSPMCQYCARDGAADDWHLVHLGSRAVGGAGMVMVEATSVSPAGRISPGCLGLWDDAQIEPLSRIARFVGRLGSVSAIQLAHAGRKASCQPSWAGGAPLTPEQGAWGVVGPTGIAYRPGDPVPTPLTEDDVERLVADYVAAAQRAIIAGFEIIEIHAAHGYLLHQFLSPLSNHRVDSFGGTFENRTRLLHLVVAAVRGAISTNTPLFVRISATDWTPGGWDLDDSARLAKDLKAQGVDLIDVSSGGISPGADIPVAPGYQVPLSRHIRSTAGIATAAVGLIVEPEQAEQALNSGGADLVFVGRAFLRDPYWPLRAQAALGHQISVPRQYGSAFSV